MKKLTSAVSVAAALSLLAPAAVAETKDASVPTIPPQFRGAGCNLKYTYAKTPKEDASECLTYWVKKKGETAHSGDNFIRIGDVDINGVDWGCTVREVKASTKTEFKFVGGCSSESNEYAMEVTLTLKPGAVVIVDTLGLGHENDAHYVDKYHILPGLK